MKRVISISLLCVLTSLSARAFQLPDIPKVPLNPSKLDDAWDGTRPVNQDDPTMAPGFLPDRGPQYDYERAARSEAEQLGPALTAYHYILQNGFNKTPNFLDKFLGVTGVLFGYQYLVEPSFREGKYTRTDTYDSYLGIPLQRTFIADGVYRLVENATPVYDVVFKFRRQFKDPKEAILSRPYFVRNLPLTAQNAIDNMNPGDLFSFEANLNIVVGIDSLAAVKILKPGANFGPFAMVSGGFNVMVLRLPNNKLHFKIFSYRDPSIGMKAEVGLINTPKISQINIIDNKIVDVILETTDLLSADIQKSWNKTLTLDYVIDLSHDDDHKIADAFNQAMTQVREFDYVNAADVRKSSNKYLYSTLTNVTALEDLVKQGVIKSSRHTADQDDEKSHQIKIGNKILRMQIEHTNAINSLLTSVNDQAAQNYVLATRKDRFEFSFFYSLFETKQYSTNGLLTLKNSNNEDRAVGLVEISEKTTRHFSRADLQDAKNALASANPQVSSETDFSKWDALFASGQKVHNVQTRTEAVLTISSIQSIGEMTSAQIYDDLVKYISKLPIDHLLPIRLSSEDTQGPLRRLETHIRKLSVQLAQIFAVATPGTQKAEKLSALFSDSLFRTFGWGYILRLMPEDARANCYQRFTMSATGLEMNLETEKGPEDLMHFYRDLLTVDNLTNDEEVDLDLESERID